ncbi:hypothetical protein ABZ816_34615 [Actinosynnema sp. NPDC047251]|uniref:Uncharacterized protein n=1 Tax=Saccharothrix espanaensis (strain ATCC 51144 / DSM 44229 / JCM 9112 / NBRC 15066 / NRRL 15764) TaxID=1179773 RepID=K0K1G4_SACES|nr:hypothetical protein [Saccharothrix espanaensis]CCH32166.1 hypothetical protein BN6_48950 [Saccharothrix espanaensis DSM 44229]
MVDDADPTRIHALDDLKAEFDLLRRVEGRRLGKHRLSLQDLVKRVKEQRDGREVPRSTLDNYLTGRTLAPHDVYADILRALGIDTGAQGPWADAWDRIDDCRRQPPADVPARDTPPDVPPAPGRSRRKRVLIGVLAGAAVLALVVAVARFPRDEPTTVGGPTGVSTMSVNGLVAGPGDGADALCPGPQKICLWAADPGDPAGRYGPVPPSWSLTDSRIPPADALAGFNNSNQNQKVWSDVDSRGQCAGSHRVWFANERFTNHRWPIRCVNHS